MWNSPHISNATWKSQKLDYLLNFLYIIFLKLDTNFLKLNYLFGLFLQGRTNKLVDGCYSFWQGGIFPLLHEICEGAPQDTWLFECRSLQEYLLLCCQDPRGGLGKEKRMPLENMTKLFYGSGNTNQPIKMWDFFC